MASVFAVLLFLILCDNVNALKCYHSNYEPIATNQSHMVTFRKMRTVEDGCNYCEYERNHDNSNSRNQRFISEAYVCVKDKEWKPENALQRCQPALFYTPESNITKGVDKDSIMCNTDLCNLSCDEYAAKKTTTSSPIPVPKTNKNLNTTTSKSPFVSIFENMVPYLFFAIFGSMCSCCACFK